MACHEKGVLHRDIKEQIVKNKFLAKLSKSDRAYVHLKHNLNINLLCTYNDPNRLIIPRKFKYLYKQSIKIQYNIYILAAPPLKVSREGAEFIIPQKSYNLFLELWEV